MISSDRGEQHGYASNQMELNALQRDEGDKMKTNTQMMMFLYILVVVVQEINESMATRGVQTDECVGSGSGNGRQSDDDEDVKFILTSGEGSTSENSAGEIVPPGPPTPTISGDGPKIVEGKPFTFSCSPFTASPGAQPTSEYSYEVLRNGVVVARTAAYTPVQADRDGIILRCTDTVHYDALKDKYLERVVEELKLKPWYSTTVPTSKTTPNVPVIALGATAGLLAIALLVVSLLFWNYRGNAANNGGMDDGNRRRQHEQASNQMELDALQRSKGVGATFGDRGDNYTSLDTSRKEEHIYSGDRGDNYTSLDTSKREEHTYGSVGHDDMQGYERMDLGQPARVILA